VIFVVVANVYDINHLKARSIPEADSIPAIREVKFVTVWKPLVPKPVVSFLQLKTDTRALGTRYIPNAFQRRWKVSQSDPE